MRSTWRTRSRLDAIPGAAHSIQTSHIFRYHQIEFEDYARLGIKQDAAFLDFCGPLTPKRISALRELWGLSQPLVLAVNSMQGRLVRGWTAEIAHEKLLEAMQGSTIIDDHRYGQFRQAGHTQEGAHMIRPGSIYLVWGPSGGFYWRYAPTPLGRYWRLCLWWVAIVWLPLDIDELVSDGADSRKFKIEPGEIERLRRTRATALKLWDTWHDSGYDKPHREMADALEFTKEEKLAAAARGAEERSKALASLPAARRCRHRDHNPPTAAVALAFYGLGAHESVCPACKERTVFTVNPGGVTYS